MALHEKTDLTMRKQETRDFFINWDIRFVSIDSTTLGGLFDKFTTLFTGFNRLYNDAYIILKSEGKIEKSRLADWEKAISIPVEFIGASKIIEKLNDTGNREKISSVLKLMDGEIFSINLVEGRQNKDADEQLKANLRSEDHNLQARAILSLIYQIRNNMQHGEKHFEEYQRLLLSPSIDLLTDIVKLMRLELDV